MQCNAMSITEAGRGPLFPAHSKKLKYTKVTKLRQTLNEITLHFWFQVAQL